VGVVSAPIITGQKGIPLVTSDGTLRMVVFVPVEVPDLVQTELTMDEKCTVMSEPRGNGGKIILHGGMH
jgi:hypothetical protein